MFVLRRPARDDERGEFHGPEEAVSVEVVDGYAVIRCSQETTARAARRKGWSDVEEEVSSPGDAGLDGSTESPEVEAPVAPPPSRRRR